MSNINNIENELKDLGIDIPTGLKAPMELPIGYFENFSDSILDQIKSEDFLATLPKKMPFEVDKNYFNSLENDILATIKAEDFVATLPKKMPFEVDKNYFNSLENDILATIKAEDFVETLPKQMPFEVPKGYFEGLENELKSKIEFPKKEIAPLRVTHSKFKVISIAASIVLFLGLSFMFLKPSNSINVEQQLSKISTSEIDAYIQQHQAEFSTDLATENIDESSIDINKLENEILQSQINNLSEEDLKNYL